MRKSEFIQLLKASLDTNKSAEEIADALEHVLKLKPDPKPQPKISEEDRRHYRQTFNKNPNKPLFEKILDLAESRDDHSISEKEITNLIKVHRIGDRWCTTYYNLVIRTMNRKWRKENIPYQFIGSSSSNHLSEYYTLKYTK